MPIPPDEELLRAAFRQVHAARLHGFALMITLGDRSAAAQLAGEVLAEGTRRVHELRHPERAAACMRARVLRRARRGRARGSIETPSTDARLATLRPLGIGRSLFEALSGLSPIERAALVASFVERLQPADVEIILDANPATTRRIVASARARYLAASTNTVDELPAGPLTTRVRSIAARTFAPIGRS
jgi:DNA-directed RNA polymerase specialized sigma24 family protein